MALVLDSVFRPKQAHLHDLSRSEGADTGRGEAFADALLRAGSPDTEGSDPATAPQIAAPAAPQAAAPPQYDTSGNPRAAAAAAAAPLAPGGKDNTAPREPALTLTGSDPATAPQLTASTAPQAAAPPQYDTSGNPRAAAAAAPLAPGGKDNTAPREPALTLTGSDPATAPQLAASAAPQAAAPPQYDTSGNPRAAAAAAPLAPGGKDNTAPREPALTLTGSDPATAPQLAAPAAPQPAARPDYETAGNPRAAAAASAAPLPPSGKDNTAPREPALPLTGSDPATAPQLAAPAAPQAAAPPQYDTSGNPRAAAAAAPLAPGGKDNTAPREPALTLTGSDPATAPQLAARPDYETAGNPRAAAAASAAPLPPSGKDNTAPREPALPLTGSDPATAPQLAAPAAPQAAAPPQYDTSGNPRAAAAAAAAPLAPGGKDNTAPREPAPLTGSDPATAPQLAAPAAPQAAAPPQYDTSGNPRAAAAAAAAPPAPGGKDNTAPREPALPLTGSDPATAPQLAASAAPQAAAPPQYDTSGNPRAAAAAAPLAPGGKDNTAPREPALPLTGSDPATAPQLAASAAPQAGGATGAGLLSANGKRETGQIETAAKPGSGAAPIAADQARQSDPQGADAALTSAAAGLTGPAPLHSTETPALSDTSAQTGQSSLSVSAATYTAPSGPASALPAPAPTGLTPAHAMVVAAPAQVVDIVSSAADDGQSDSIIVQLDPPELGRVSIDFKFDANGLQHVTITGETSEAMRQLRLMHFELIQALERHGIGSSNMTFQQQQQQHTPQSPLPNPLAGEPVKDRPGSAEAGHPVIPAYSLSSPRTPPGGRLDMKL